MFDTVLGLPTHPLVAHVAVAFIPVFALLTLLYAALPVTRVHLKWPVVGTGVIAAIGAFLAVGTGEELEDRLKRQNAQGVDWDLVHRHGEAGELLRVVAILLVIITLVLVFTLLSTTRNREHHSALSTGLAVLLVLGALFTLYQTYETGHTGAKAVWGSTVQQ